MHKQKSILLSLHLARLDFRRLNNWWLESENSAIDIMPCVLSGSNHGSFDDAGGMCLILSLRVVRMIASVLTNGSLCVIWMFFDALFWASDVEAQGYPFSIPDYLVINPALAYCFTSYRIRPKKTSSQEAYFVIIDNVLSCHS